MPIDNRKPPNYHHELKPTKKGKKKPIKVTYISSPMMVRARNASEFRAIVQELTGKNSNLGQTYHDSNAFGGSGGQVIDDHGISSEHGFISTHPKPAGFTDHECSNMVQSSYSSLEFNESFWREVSKSLGFQYPFVLV